MTPRPAMPEMSKSLLKDVADEAVEMLIKKRGDIRTDIDLLKLGSALAATRVLTHEQHSKVLIITREIALNRSLRQQDSRAHPSEPDCVSQTFPADRIEATSQPGKPGGFWQELRDGSAPASELPRASRYAC